MAWGVRSCSGPIRERWRNSHCGVRTELLTYEVAIFRFWRAGEEVQGEETETDGLLEGLLVSVWIISRHLTL